jgi:ADP-ribose pyrophosphatase
MKVEVLSRRVAFDGFMRVEVLYLRHELYNGSMSAVLEREVVHAPNAVAALLYNPETGKLIFVEQYRPAIDQWILEVASGALDHLGEDEREAMVREVPEETGWFVNSLDVIAEYYASPGRMSERTVLYYAEVTDKIGDGGGCSAEHEDIRVVEMSPSEAYERLAKGEIQTPAAIIGIQWFKERETRG